VVTTKAGRKSASKAVKKAKKRTSSTKVGRGKKGAVGRYPKGTATYDSKSARWRDGARFISAPTGRQVRRDKAGRPIDARGRRVPAMALAPAPKKRPVKKKPAVKMPTFTEAKPTKPPRLRIVPRFGEIAAGSPVVEKEFLSSTFRNRQTPEDAGEILSKVFYAHADKGPFEADDIPIYQVGVKFVGEGPPIKSSMVDFAEGLPKGASIDFSETRAGTEVYVRFNTSGTPLLLEQAEQVLSSERNQTYLQKLYESLLDYWGGLDWYVWAETNESLYE
jgi:hypothetical protein